MGGGFVTQEFSIRLAFGGQREEHETAEQEEVDTVFRLREVLKTRQSAEIEVQKDQGGVQEGHVFQSKGVGVGGEEE